MSTNGFTYSRSFDGFAVDDVDAAERFYRDTLGVATSRVEGNDALLTLHLGEGSETLVYPKPGHTPADYTILNFAVPDVDAAVDALTAAGVRFQRYDGMPQDEKGIMRGNGPDIAWFTDPAGNILSVLAD
jgi:catechol 2,3-dioxygenase-like lactoylglutathione lyase family enzyme